VQIMQQRSEPDRNITLLLLVGLITSAWLVVEPAEAAGPWSPTGKEWSYPGGYANPSTQGSTIQKATTAFMSTDCTNSGFYSGAVGVPLLARLGPGAFVGAVTRSSCSGFGATMRVVVCGAYYIEPTAYIIGGTPVSTQASQCGDLSQSSSENILQINGVNDASHSIATSPSLNFVGVCWTNSGAEELLFVRFDSLGAQGPVRIAHSAASTSRGCSVSSTGDNTYWLVFIDTTATPNVAKLTKTTDGGNTFTVVSTIDTQTSISLPLILSKDDNNHAIHLSTNLGHRTCASNDAGVTFSCSTFTSTQLNVKPFGLIHGGAYYALVSQGGAAKLLKSLDGLGWVQRNAPVANQFTIHTDGTILIPKSDGSSSAAPSLIRGSSSGLCSATYPCAEVSFGDYYTSTNDGQSWSTLVEGARTLCSTQYGHCSGGTTAAALYVGENLAMSFSNSQPTSNGGAGSQIISVLAPTGPSVIGAAATATVSNLVGFDVDTHAGTTVIARTGTAGANVQTWNGITLGSSISTATTGCNRSNGVIAAISVVAYLHCDSNENPSELRIRGSNLGDPFFSDCDDADVCPQNVPLNNAGVCFGNSGESGLADRTVIDAIADTEDVPLTWDYVTDRLPATADSRAIAIAFTTTAGRIGILQYTASDDPAGSNICDYWAVELANYGSFGSTIEQLCSWRFGSANLIGVVDDQSSARLYQYTPVIRSNGVLDGTLSEFPALGVSNGIGIACAGEYVAIMTQAQAPSKNLYVFNITRGSGQPQWSFTVESPKQRGVALSGDAKWVGFVDGGKIRVAWTSNGTIVGNITSDNSENKQLRMSFAGNNLWQAKTTSIARYEISVVTGGVKCEAVDCTITPSEPPESEVPVQHPLYGKGAIGEKIPGAGNPFFSLFLSILTIMGPAALAFKLTGGGYVRGRLQTGSPAIIGSAAFAGMCLAVYAFDFPLAVPIMVSVVAVALIVQRFWANGSSA
jgi:hypothetical protein